MLSKNITPDTDYVHGSRRARLGQSWLQRVRAVTAAEHGRVWVQALEEDGTEKDRRQVQVPVRELIGTWADHSRIRQEVAATKAEALTRIQTQVAEMKAHLPKGVALPHMFDGHQFADGSFARDGRVTVADLHTLILAAYKAGQESIR